MHTDWHISLRQLTEQKQLSAPRHVQQLQGRAFSVSCARWHWSYRRCIDISEQQLSSVCCLPGTGSTHGIFRNHIYPVVAGGLTNSGHCICRFLHRTNGGTCGPRTASRAASGGGRPARPPFATPRCSSCTPAPRCLSLKLPQPLHWRCRSLLPERLQGGTLEVLFSPVPLPTPRRVFRRS